MSEVAHITWSPEGGFREWKQAVIQGYRFLGLGPEMGLKTLLPCKSEVRGSWHLHGAIQVHPKNFVTEKPIAIQKYIARMDAAITERRSVIKTAHASLRSYAAAKAQAETALKELTDESR